MGLFEIKQKYLQKKLSRVKKKAMKEQSKLKQEAEIERLKTKIQKERQPLISKEDRMVLEAKRKQQKKKRADTIKAIKQTAQAFAKGFGDISEELSRQPTKKKKKSKKKEFDFIGI